MPRLIHLNGPPGIGKSTLARMYVDEHVGTLNLDIDQVRCLIGGWREDFAETGELARPIALSMAATHLRSGHDVVMPQYLGQLSEIERFEATATDNGAEFREIVLMDTKTSSIARFARRGAGNDAAWHEQVRAIVVRKGGEALLAQMYDQLADVVQRRSTCVVVRSEPDAAEEAYASVTAALQRTS